MENVINLLKRLKIKEYTFKTSSFMEMLSFHLQPIIKVKIYFYLDKEDYILKMFYDDTPLNTEIFSCYEDLELYVIREFNLCRNR